MLRRIIATALRVIATILLLLSVILWVTSYRTTINVLWMGREGQLGSVRTERIACSNWGRLEFLRIRDRLSDTNGGPKSWGNADGDPSVGRSVSFLRFGPPARESSNAGTIPGMTRRWHGMNYGQSIVREWCTFAHFPGHSAGQAFFSSLPAHSFNFEFTVTGTRLLEYRFIAIPYWPLVAVFSLLPFRWAFIWWRRRIRRRNGECLHCGYNLWATPGRCPECGEVPGQPRKDARMALGARKRVKCD